MSKKMLLLFLICAGLSVPSSAAIIANSINEFSGTQGQSGWFYGFYNQTTLGLPYSTSGFVQFQEFDGTGWRATDAQVDNPVTGVINNFFLTTNQVGGHPTGIGPGEQDSVIWSMRRYVSEVAGTISVVFDAHKINIVNPNGNGITARIFVDGTPVFTQTIGNLDGFGVQGVLVANVNIGSLIDFAIDPTGTGVVGGDTLQSARADGSHFSAIIHDGPVPEPSAVVIWCSLGAGIVLAAGRRRIRTRSTCN